MSSARLQDTRSIYKNQLYFYTLAMNTPKMNSIYNSIKKILINLKEMQDLYTKKYKALLNDTKINKYLMFVNWKV